MFVICLINVFVFYVSLATVHTTLKSVVFPAMDYVRVGGFG